MKRLILLVGMMLLPLVVSSRLVPYYDSLLSVKAEEDRLTLLGVSFSEAGDAADIYLPYLQKDAAIAKNAWFSEISSSCLADKDPLACKWVKPALAAAGPDLDELVKASRRKDANLWKQFKPDPATDVFQQPLPDYFNLRQLTVLLDMRGLQLDRDGKPDQALEQLLASLRIGCHLEKDRILLGRLVGLGIKISAADALARHFSANADAAAKWTIYGQLQRARAVESRRVVEQFASWEAEDAKAFIRNTDFPEALNFEGLIQLHYCVSSDFAIVKCGVAGPPDWVVKAEDDYAKKDEFSKAMVTILREHSISAITLRKWLDAINK
jgi:hypothetical protein